MRYIYILFLLITFISCKNNTILYFDQEPPSTIPKLFAPSIVNTDNIELNIVFNTNNTEMFFSRIVDNSFVIHHSELTNGKWSDIKPIKMYDDNVLVSVACDPTITKDGKTMYFLGVDPKLYKNDVTREELYTIPPDIYKSKKVNGKWELASKVDFLVSTEYLETYPVVTADGSLYFRSNRPSDKGGMNTYRAQYLGNEKFKPPVIINTKTEKKELITYVSPDERYAITNGQGKFQITFNDNGEWTKPKETPLKYESNWRYYCPYMSSDGKYFIYSRKYNNPEKKGWAGVEKGEVYWVNADVLFNAKKE
ncbi:WD40-like Beta Propeller Repeat [Aquimarina amphilecti]|uniref:WD40-like Beta Propeller Repeat n=1 Tax=Aquimarina amphilecti TaxID=1038014 RepID=A0A1H7QT83_AQUAM|nr:PD40 domain-containing protein [Aquimarina amphilecti]SEL50835.1 WD40-like Beta Propeller Repeat [Aquimarina amphilecti]